MKTDFNKTRLIIIDPCIQPYRLIKWTNIDIYDAKDELIQAFEPLLIEAIESIDYSCSFLD